MDGTGDWIDLGSSTILASNTQPFTVAWEETPIGTPPAYALVCAINAGTNSLTVFHAAAGDSSYGRLTAGKAGAFTAKRFADAPAQADGVPNRWMLVASAGLDSTTGAEWNLYVDGVLYAASTGATTAATTGVTRIGSGSAGASTFKGVISNFALWDVAFTASEAIDWFSAPYQHYSPVARRVYFDAGAGGAVTLVHQDTSQTQSVDNVSLTTLSSLVVQDSTQSHQSENVVLDASSTVNLVVQETTHNQSVESLTITVGSVLTLQDSTHSHSSENTVLSTTNTLILQDSEQGQTSENVTLDSGLILTIDDSISTQQVDSLTLLASSILSVSDSTQIQQTDSIDLSTLHSLVVSKATQTVLSEEPALTIPGSGTGATAEEIAAAVVAALEATTIPVDIKKVNSISITGVGTDPNPWRAV